MLKMVPNQVESGSFLPLEKSGEVVGVVTCEELPLFGRYKTNWFKGFGKTLHTCQTLGMFLVQKKVLV